jgi:hypothetical protein
MALRPRAAALPFAASDSGASCSAFAADVTVSLAIAVDAIYMSVA